MKTLEGKKIAIITENGFEEEELIRPKKAFEEAGATVHIISPCVKTVKAWNMDQWSVELPVDITISNAAPEDYDALVIPGGVLHTDLLRRNETCIEFVRHFIDYNKPVGAVSHGPQILIETGLIAGREMTSAGSLKTDIENAGAFWHDEHLVSDNGLITSRNTEDLPEFIKKMEEEIAEENHAAIF